MKFCQDTIAANYRSLNISRKKVAVLLKPNRIGVIETTSDGRPL